MVHEVGPARDGRGLEREGLDERRIGLRGRRHRRTLVLLVDVVDEPDVDASLVRGDERAIDDVGRVVVETDVVERELERLLAPSTNAAIFRAMSSDVWPPSVSVSTRIKR